MVGRGLTKRCPRCGSGRLFRRWFTMVRHCPGCGMRFERDSGFFLGAYVMNYAAAAGVVAVVMGVIIVLESRSTGGSADLLPVIVVGSCAAILIPLVFYPVSKTLWTAIELIMKPLDIAEEAEATVVLADQATSSDNVPEP